MDVVLIFLFSFLMVGWLPFVFLLVYRKDFKYYMNNSRQHYSVKHGRIIDTGHTNSLYIEEE